jgi:dienelactone hydrolase
MRRVWVWGLLIAAVAGAVVLGNTLRSYAGLFTAARGPAELSALLSPAYVVNVPEGAGPFPTALLFSGCDGPHDNLPWMASQLNRMGWAAVTVDSHGPRGFDKAEVWRLVCAGQLLGGAERAGDVAVALADVRAMDFVDDDRLALIGSSHGGWAVLDLMALHGAGRLPYNLTAWPVPSEDVLAGVRAVVLYYPYCGFGSQVSRLGWQADIPALFLLVEGDTVAGETACQQIIADMTAAGRPIEEIVFPGVTHGFDQQEKASFSLLGYDEATTVKAFEATRDFLYLNVPPG